MCGAAMNDEKRFWLGSAVTIVLAVSVAAIQSDFASGSQTDRLLRVALYCGIGLAGLASLWVITKLSPAVRRIRVQNLARVAWIVSAMIAVAALWLGVGWLRSPSGVGPVSPSTATKSAQATGPDRAFELPDALLGKSWALDGESCDKDAIRFDRRGRDLVANPMGSPPILYQISIMSDKRLVTTRNKRTVIFEVARAGFIYVDGGYRRWYHLCG